MGLVLLHRRSGCRAELDRLVPEDAAEPQADHGSSSNMTAFPLSPTTLGGFERVSGVGLTPRHIARRAEDRRKVLPGRTEPRLHLGPVMTRVWRYPFARHVPPHTMTDVATD